jgi:hypothetical protein
MGMSVDSIGAIGRSSLFIWQVSADQEEPWRRFLQELSGSRFEEYAESRRRMGIFAESVWFAPKPYGGGVAVVLLQAEDPERALNELVAELAASETPFGSCIGKEMHNLFGYDFVRLPGVAGGELLFAWREMWGAGEQQPPEDS